MTGRQGELAFDLLMETLEPAAAAPPAAEGVAAEGAFIPVPYELIVRGSTTAPSGDH